MNRRSLLIADHSHLHDRLLACSSTTVDYKNAQQHRQQNNDDEEDVGQDTVPLQKQQSTDNPTDSEQTMTSHLSLPHFALHRQVKKYKLLLNRCEFWKFKNKRGAKIDALE